jgi:hypothetical protein
MLIGQTFVPSVQRLQKLIVASRGERPTEGAGIDSDDAQRIFAEAFRPRPAYWIRALAAKKGVWANIPPNCNRESPICLSPYLYRAHNLIERCGDVDPDLPPDYGHPLGTAPFEGQTPS